MKWSSGLEYMLLDRQYQRASPRDLAWQLLCGMTFREVYRWSLHDQLRRERVMMGIAERLKLRSFNRQSVCENHPWG